MAVVQISKIQLRRGKKNSGTGLPQLASGELAWAIDTQELFVGNGSVGEGAPYVGNTKILTEHDSILDLIANYTYKYDSALGQSLIEGTVTRTLQSRLDDGVVNARNFGIVSSIEWPAGTEVEDQTAKIQQAIDSITRDDRSPNVTIEFEPGEYYFSDTITLPSNVKIAGYGKNETIFTFTGTADTLFTTEEDATKIKLRDFTIKTTSNNKTLLKLDNAKECDFVNVKLLHESGLNDEAGTLSNNRIGISLIGNGTVAYNRFKGLEFKNLTYGVFAGSNASFNKFEDCLLEYLYQGFNLGTGSSGGSNYNIITNCIFDKITRQGLFVQKGTGNRSRGNTYKDVGSTQSGTFSAFSVIRFVTDGNSSMHDIFERMQYLEPNDPAFNNNPYIPEIDGVAYREKMEPRKVSLTFTNQPTMVFKVGIGDASGLIVNYVFRSTTYDQTRRGTLTVVVDKELNIAQLTDEYEYIGTSPAGEDAVIFTATVQTSGNVKVLRINYTNSNTGDANSLTYTYSLMS